MNISTTSLADLLLAMLEGRTCRFDNSKPVRMLPARHPFSVTCDCADCAHVWADR
jgi:hypothetical protein